ncbi:hypothetical protein [Brevibacillus brevis]|uniref:hypothetical protein n=1 Tax=Brevibacillus brevis TaxID=1393 RepID=UPI00165EAFFB|nr:hypothetical protein [Brevibacillus brevis]
MKKSMSVFIVTSILLGACSSAPLEEAEPVKTEPPSPTTSTKEVKSVDTSKSEEEEKQPEMVTVSKSTGLGDTLTYYTVFHGDNAGDATMGSFMNGFLLPMFVDQRAVEVRLSFESTTNHRRTEEEAARMIKDYIPIDAKQTKEFSADGIKGVEYESETLAKVFEGSTTPDEQKPGTFKTYLKYDSEGVFAAVASLGPWKP